MADLLAKYFSDTDLEAISGAIKDAESRTSGEIVVRVAKRSYNWLAEKLLIASMLSLVTVAVSLVVTRTNDWGAYYDFSQALLWGIISFLIGFFFIAPLIRTRHRRAQATWKHALQVFHSLPATKGSTGVLIFISLDESEAAIVADKGIALKVPPRYWDGPHGRLAAELRKNRHSEGIIAAVKEIAATLAEHFPATGENPNEIPDAPSEA